MSPFVFDNVASDAHRHVIALYCEEEETGNNPKLYMQSTLTHTGILIVIFSCIAASHESEFQYNS